jgi:3-deoxy-D-manno-octulosonic-acid transferase
VDEGELARLGAALAGRPILLAAGTHEGEDAVVAEAHRRLRGQLPDLCTIIAPRHPERGPAIAGMLLAEGITVARRGLGQPPGKDSEVYIADTLGELGTLYKLCGVAFVGGSLVDVGGHNPIEAVRQGAVVLTGPHWQNFADTYEALLKQEAAIVVTSAEELADAAARLLADAAELARMRQRAEKALAGLSGALSRTVEALLRHLPAEDELAPAS